eukprot:g3500.t1
MSDKDTPKTRVNLSSRMAALNTWGRKIGQHFHHQKVKESDMNASSSPVHSCVSREKDEEDDSSNAALQETIAHLEATLEAKSEMWQTNQAAMGSALDGMRNVEMTQKKELESLECRAEKQVAEEEKARRGLLEQEERVAEELHACRVVVENECRASRESREIIVDYEGKLSEQERAWEDSELTLRESLSTSLDAMGVELESEIDVSRSLAQKVAKASRHESMLAAKISQTRQRYCRAIASRDECESVEKTTRVRSLELAEMLSDREATIERVRVEYRSQKRKLAAVRKELQRRSACRAEESGEDRRRQRNKTAQHEEKNSADKFEARLRQFYAKYDPSSVSNVAILLSAFERSTKSDLMMRLVEHNYPEIYAGDGGTSSPRKGHAHGSGFLANASDTRAHISPPRSPRARDAASDRTRMTGAQKFRLHEDDNLVHWGLQQQLEERERLFADELQEIGLQHRMLRQQQRHEMACLKSSHEAVLKAQLRLAREEHEEAMVAALKARDDVVVRREDLALREFVVDTRAVSASHEGSPKRTRTEENSEKVRPGAEKVASSTEKAATTQPTALSLHTTTVRTPCRVLDRETRTPSSSQSTGARKQRARMRAERRRRMRDEEAETLVEASGITDGANAGGV